MSNDLVEDYYKSMDEFFKGKVRGVTETDRKMLPRMSYSGLEVFKNCPYQFPCKIPRNKLQSTPDNAQTFFCQFLIVQSTKCLC